MFLSIFTPTYNRGHLLPRLYESLKKQSCKEFEWVIVDDGSLDNTKDIVQKFIDEREIIIKYSNQVNSGKHIAINKGAILAEGEFFFIVDSDDYLTPDSVQFIKEKCNLIRDIKSIAGISGRKGYSENKVIGSKLESFDNLICNALDFRYKFKISGDMAEVVKVKILRDFPFPVILGENFCTEGLIWGRIAQYYSFVWYSNIIYIAEYLEGGLSASSCLIRMRNPKYATLYYAEHQLLRIPILQNIKSNINYWRFAKYLNNDFEEKWSKVNPYYSLIGYPLSFIFRIIDKM